MTRDADHRDRVLQAIGDYQRQQWLLTRKALRMGAGGQSENPQQRAGNGPKGQTMNQEVRSMEDLGPIVISGTVTEKASRSETEKGTPVATWRVAVSRQWCGPVNLWSQVVWCRATGYPANSAFKYIRSGIDVIVAGKLRRWTVPTDDGKIVEELSITVEQVAYMSVRQVMEAKPRTW